MKAENLKSEQRFANDDRGEANMKLDLHTHSTASDGQYGPAEMVQKAKDADLELYALTDHDTVAGQNEAIAKAKELGVRYIPGIEISTQEGEEIHILGLFIDPDNKILLEKCQIFEEDRRNRGKKIVAFLQEKGIDISLEEVQKIAEKVKPNVPFGMELDEKYRELLLTPVEQETGLKREI